MRQRQVLLLAVLLTRHQTFAQSSGTATIFLLDAEPQTVEASVIAYTSGDTPVTTLLLSCPSAFAPCVSASIDGAIAYHTQGSVFGGTLPGATPTTFYCELGSGSGDTIPDQGGQCTRTVGSETTSTAMNSAYVSAHQAEVIITAGLEKLSASALPCTSRAQLFSTLQLPSVTSAGDIWGWATECPNPAIVTSTTSSQTVSPASSQSSQTSNQASSVRSSSTSSSASTPSATSTETKASGASVRIAGSFMFAQVLGVIMVWVIS